MQLSRLLRKPRKRNAAGFFRRRRPLLGTTPPKQGTQPPDREVPAVSPHMRGCNIADYRAETSHECHPEPHASASSLCHPEPQDAAKDLVG